MQKRTLRIGLSLQSHAAAEQKPQDHVDKSVYRTQLLQAIVARSRGGDSDIGAGQRILASLLLTQSDWVRSHA